MRRLVLGTAGHIDHGKTTLVRALTGVDTDRLPEEKRRGITIDLGFAELRAGADLTFSIVDVPGHESFIRNMVAGASGMDLVLVVVAADEGVMPQTREHLAIVTLLGITRGVVVLTKADLVDEEWLQLVRDDVAALLRASPLRAAPILPVSTHNGMGLDDLLTALRTAAHGHASGPDDDLFRMPVDRVFTVRGTGTVVTGTVWSGRLRRDSQVRLLPSGVTGRVRSLQQHGVECAEVHAGTRAAIALAGVDRTELARGETVVADAAWTPAGILTVALHAVAGLDAPIRPRQRVRLHIGTAEVLGRIGMIEQDLAPGDRTLAQIRLERSVVARAGDRFVLRSYSPVDTIAGGVVLEPLAPKRRRLEAGTREALADLEGTSEARTHADGDTGIVLAAIRLSGPEGLETRLLPIVTGLTPPRIEAALSSLQARDRSALAGQRLVTADRLARVRAFVESAVRRHHQDQPMQEGLAREAARRLLPRPDAWLFDTAVEELLRSGGLTTVGNQLAVPGHVVRLGADAEGARGRLEALYAHRALEPPDLADLPQDLRDRADLLLLLRLLETAGTLLRLSPTRWISAAAVFDAARSLRAHVAAGEPVDMAELKNVLKLSRKHLIPLLEHFDRTGVTRRDGDLRRVLPADRSGVSPKEPGGSPLAGGAERRL